LKETRGMMVRDRNAGGGVLSDAARGALAGFVAAWAMDRVDTALHRLEPESSRRLTRAVRPEGKDPVHLEASRISEALGRGPLSESHPAGLAVYCAIGAAAGALYGALRRRHPGVAAGRGAAFGLGRFVLEDLVHNPLAGLAAPNLAYPWQAHGRQAAGLLTHALVTDALLRLTDEAGGRTPRRSAKAWLVESLLPLTGMKRAFRDEETLRRDVARRRKVEPALPPSRLRRRFRVEEGTVAGMRVFTVAPRTDRAGPVVLYLHGGAYVRDVMGPQWSFVERLAAQTGATIAAPRYPLAPEHSWRDAFARLMPLYERLSEHFGPGRLTLLGDSASGGLALALAQRLRDRARPLPARLVLLAPWLDVTLSDSAQGELARRDPMLDIPGLRAAGRWWAGDLDPRDPIVSPLFGDLDDLPPIALFTGTDDLVHPDARRLRDKASASGADLAYHEYPGMFHVWPLADIPEGNEAIARMAAFIAGRGAYSAAARRA